MPRTRSVRRTSSPEWECDGLEENGEIEIAEAIDTENIIVERCVESFVDNVMETVVKQRDEEVHEEEVHEEDVHDEKVHEEEGLVKNAPEDNEGKLSAMEAWIFLHLCNAFQVIASRWSDPPYLVMLGTVAGGAFGIHLAALTIGFLQAFILNGWRRLLARCLIELTFLLQSALVIGTWRCAALHHFGDTVYTVSESGIITPSSAASLTLSVIGMLIPGWQCTLLVVFHSCFSLYKFRAR